MGPNNLNTGGKYYQKGAEAVRGRGDPRPSMVAANGPAAMARRGSPALRRQGDSHFFANAMIVNTSFTRGVAVQS